MCGHNLVRSQCLPVCCTGNRATPLRNAPESPTSQHTVPDSIPFLSILRLGLHFMSKKPRISFSMGLIENQPRCFKNKSHRMGI